MGSDEVVVAFLDVRTDDVDVEEGLLDQLFHALDSVGVRFSSGFENVSDIPSMFCKCATGN